ASGHRSRHRRLLAQIRGPGRRSHRHALVRRLGPGRGAVRTLRVHRGQRRRGGEENRCRVRRYVIAAREGDGDARASRQGNVECPYRALPVYAFFAVDTKSPIQASNDPAAMITMASAMAAGVPVKSTPTSTPASAPKPSCDTPNNAEAAPALRG